jgi:uncharacterized protein (TIGR03437 family)
VKQNLAGTLYPACMCLLFNQAATAGQFRLTDLPTFGSAGVLNAASYRPEIAPYTWVSLFGTGLASSTREWSDRDFIGRQLPTELDGVSVQFNGRSGYVSYISPGQLNVLLPTDTGSGSEIRIQVFTTRGASAPVTVAQGRLAPALFMRGSESRYVAAVYGDGMAVGAETAGMRRARPGDVIVLFGNGFGAPAPPALGSELITAPVRLATPVTASIGNTAASVAYAGVVMPGVYQFNVVVPQLPDGEWPVVIEAAGLRTQDGAVIPVDGGAVSASPRGIIIDHTTTDLSQIPDEWIDRAKKNTRMYFGHTSHGMQLSTGLMRLQSQGSKYGAAIASELPADRNALRIMDVSAYDWDPDFYPTVAKTLRSNPDINIVMYVWCTQPTTREWKSLFEKYTTDMQSLERQFPNTTFVYVTGNAQEQDCAGCDRHQFNEALRRFARDNGKVLFDFGDLDVWSNGKRSTYSSPAWCSAYGCSGGMSIPAEHPDWGGGDYNNPCGHATYASCDNKAKAMWWLFARLAGWPGPGGAQTRLAGHTGFPDHSRAAAPQENACRQTVPIRVRPVN